MTSICAEDFSSALAGIGAKVRDSIEPCMAQPLAGCSQGTSGTSCSPCLPTCQVTDLVHWSRQDQKQYDVPWCGALCQHGLCTKLDLSPCNSDDHGRCTCNAGLYPTKTASSTPRTLTAPLLSIPRTAHPLIPSDCRPLHAVRPRSRTHSVSVIVAGTKRSPGTRNRKACSPPNLHQNIAPPLWPNQRQNPPDRDWTCSPPGASCRPSTCKRTWAAEHHGSTA